MHYMTALSTHSLTVHYMTALSTPSLTVHALQVNLLEKFTGLKKLWLRNNLFTLAEFTSGMANLKFLDMTKCSKMKMVSLALSVCGSVPLAHELIPFRYF